jgi:hypothetical protein
MNHLNKAFEQVWHFPIHNNHLIILPFPQLRHVLPTLGDGRKLSKYETLLMAQQYIDSLGELLVDPNGGGNKNAKGKATQKKRINNSGRMPTGAFPCY